MKFKYNSIFFIFAIICVVVIPSHSYAFFMAYKCGFGKCISEVPVCGDPKPSGRKIGECFRNEYSEDFDFSAAISCIIDARQEYDSCANTYLENSPVGQFDNLSKVTRQYYEALKEIGENANEIKETVGKTQANMYFSKNMEDTYNRYLELTQEALREIRSGAASRWEKQQKSFEVQDLKEELQKQREHELELQKNDYKNAEKLIDRAKQINTNCNAIGDTIYCRSN